MHGVENVRRSLARLRKALKESAPQDIDESLSLLVQAMSDIQEVERKLASGEASDRGLKAELSALVREIGLTQQMADRGLVLYRGRAMELAALAGGYGATGLPAPALTGATIRIEG